ncbi:MAG TPA: penicillin-insensitive murein endopeptidase [Solirubrobacter sp.]|nr:penicillin-insensitive murein endopeptidase [Solirubrobacter sp.]
MRSVVLAIGALLAVTAIALAQPLQDPPVEPPPPTPTAPALPPSPSPTPTPTAAPGQPPDSAAVTWRHSRALGRWFARGRLVRGVQLPALGEDYFTWDPVRNHIPNRGWRRWGTDRLVRTVLRVLHEYRTEHDGAQRVGIMDLSRPHGGTFGRRYGGLGHMSHQNGLDADILYPRKDAREARARRPSQVDRRLAQDLVDRFVAAGAIKVFVGPHLHLRGPRKVVVPLVYHDDHLHVRLRQRTS